MNAIPVDKMGNATSLFSLTRNVGASIGIAITSTWLVSNQQANTSLLGARLTVYDAPTRAALDTARSALMASGADTAAATQGAQAALFGALTQQAAMLSFVGIFRTLGLMFILIVPLLLIMRRPRR